MSQWDEQGYIGAIFEPLSNELLLNEVGIFDGDVPSSWSLTGAEATNALQSAFEYAADLAYREYLYVMRYTETPWGRFGGLLKTETLEATLGLLKEDAAVFAVVLDEGFGNQNMWAELRCCVWPLWKWVLDIMTALQGNEFEEVSDPIDTELHEWSRCPKTTKTCENVFNFCRGQSTSRANAMSAERVAHCTVMSNEAALHGRPISAISPAAKLVSSVALSSIAFKASANHDFSLGNALLERFMHAAYTEMSADQFALSGMRWKALRTLHPHVSRFAHLWDCRLVTRGQILWKPGSLASEPEGIVIGRSERGVVAMRVQLRRFDEEVYATMDVARGRLPAHVLFIADTAGWTTLKPSIVSKHAGHVRRQLKGLVFKVPRKRPESLETAHAEEGFRGLTVPLLEKLIVETAGLSLGTKKLLEKDLALMAVEHYLPHLSHEDAMLRVHKRNMKATSGATRIITEKNIDLLKQHGHLNEDDVQGFEKCVDREKLTAKFVNAQAAIKASGGVHVEGHGYIPKDIPNRAIAVEEARRYVPQRQGCWIGLNKDAAWLVKAPYRKKLPKSLTVGFSHWEDNRQAFLHVLAWIWEVEKEDNPEAACPYELKSCDCDHCWLSMLVDQPGNTNPPEKE